VKNILFITMLLGVGYSQCDANGDGDLDVLDVVIEVDCILADCWDEGEPVCEDIDGNVYETIQIGDQLWMAENLKTTKYRDGSDIPTGYSNSEWTELETGAYAVYPADDDGASQTTCGDDCADLYGNLYNWYAVDDDRGICPEGFHVASDEAFMELEMYLGMSEEEANSDGDRGTDEGSKLAGNSDLWYDGDLVNNPEIGMSGFNGLPAGNRAFSGGFVWMRNHGYFWSWSSTDIGSLGRHRVLSYHLSTVNRHYATKDRGFSIRCMREGD